MLFIHYLLVDFLSMKHQCTPVTLKIHTLGPTYEHDFT